MAADLHIHIAKDVAKEDVRRFALPLLCGSKEKVQNHPRVRAGSAITGEEFDELWDKIVNAPSVWVGEVSWLKAAIFEDAETFIPDPIQRVHDIIGEDLPVVDDDLITKIEDAMKSPNSTSYSLGNGEEIVEFLKANKGERVFTVSW